MRDRDKDAELLALRHQITALERQPGTTQLRFSPADRAFLAALLHRLPLRTLRQLQPPIRPETVLRQHRDLLARRHAAKSRPKLLDRTLIWNQRHLLHTLREYEQFYNTHRPHQGIANARPLRQLPQPTTNQAQVADLDIHRRQRLGGILNEYHQAA